MKKVHEKQRTRSLLQVARKQNLVWFQQKFFFFFFAMGKKKKKSKAAVVAC